MYTFVFGILAPLRGEVPDEEETYYVTQMMQDEVVMYDDFSLTRLGEAFCASVVVLCSVFSAVYISIIRCQYQLLIAIALSRYAGTTPMDLRTSSPTIVVGLGHHSASASATICSSLRVAFINIMPDSVLLTVSSDMPCSSVHQRTFRLHSSV